MKDDAREHCRFAIFCYWCGKNKLAKEHLDIVGNRLYTSQIFSLQYVQEVRDYLRRIK